MSQSIIRLPQNPRFVCRGDISGPPHTRQWFEYPGRQDGVGETWCFTDRLSYSAGDTLALFSISTSTSIDVEIFTEDMRSSCVFSKTSIPVSWAETPELASVQGCDWPLVLSVKIERDWPSGVYRIRAGSRDDPENDCVAEHLFIVRPDGVSAPGRLALITTDATWQAYNDWGGCNHYEGVIESETSRFSPRLSIRRPLARGFVSLPSDSPRTLPVDRPAVGSKIAYPHIEWAWQNGYSKKYASAGWASYEKHFSRWAQAQGYSVDVITQQDLHYRPELLFGYRCAVIVGHDEYWSWRMRDTIDHYVDSGGRLARFAGNFLWQIRLEHDGKIQICHKYKAREEDPLFGTSDARFTTNCWEASEVGRPGHASLGLDGSRGIYAGWGGLAVHGARGFTVYRPDHWAFEHCGLGYGDIIGEEGPVFGYEVDGLDYRVENGLPFPLPKPDLPDDLNILAMGLARLRESQDAGSAGPLFVGDEDARFIANTLYGAEDEQTLAKVDRGSGMMVNFSSGRGEVFNAGTTEWVAGLIHNDKAVVQLTRNVLDRFLRK